MPMARRALLALFVCAVIVFAGCDSGTADISGAVKYDGQLVEEGSIAFYPADGKGKTAGGSIKNGKYSANVPVGTMKVTIAWPKGTGVKKKLYDNDPKSPEIELKTEALPDKYSSPAATELQVEVKSGRNEKNWDLTK